MLIDNNDINYTKILLSIHILISLFSSLLILYCRHYLRGEGGRGGGGGRGRAPRGNVLTAAGEPRGSLGPAGDEARQAQHTGVLT